MTWPQDCTCPRSIGPFTDAKIRDDHRKHLTTCPVSQRYAKRHSLPHQMTADELYENLWRAKEIEKTGIAYAPPAFAELNVDINPTSWNPDGPTIKKGTTVRIVMVSRFGRSRCVWPIRRYPLKTPDCLGRFWRRALLEPDIKGLDCLSSPETCILHRGKHPEITGPTWPCDLSVVSRRGIIRKRYRPSYS